ncbi:hypothetical protein RHMOL_Rhmol03G0172900 [Rhododendron molle]|uniref:Uncharacterized protein n=1 Tax=Rhododendron molle TaxID=49168 RepID=A0ACC0PF62_RHOML|nr:hypothetical protein RHMOL_Rhmol03G0172900 [Rhododendron molle]
MVVPVKDGGGVCVNQGDGLSVRWGNDDNGKFVVVEVMPNNGSGKVAGVGAGEGRIAQKRVGERRKKKKGKEGMESHRNHQVIRIEDEPKSGIESSIREIQETINKSAFIIIQRRLNDMRRLEEEWKSKANRSYSFRNSLCIYRVPNSIKEMKCNLAEPELVSIGPYHRGKPAVLEFENSTKWKLVDSLLRRTGEEMGVVLQRLVDAMKELEMKARDFYSEPIEMSHDDFVQMMVIDGCFVVELLQHVCGDVNGVLEIPPLTINDVTIAALINCVAWEQCCTHTSRCFSAYVAFMNCLINSDRDITFLCDDGIITSFSHDDEQIAQTFKELGDKVVFNIRDCYLSKEFKEVEAYYGSNWATLRRTYFRSPWSFISVATAALLLGFTAIQTIMAILSYMDHSK